MKYNFIKTKNKIIALSSYGGKIVKGIAKCNPEDTFDEAKGQELAAARCDYKVAKKRIKNASKKYQEAKELFVAAEKHCLDMQLYLNDAIEAEVIATKHLIDILEKI